MSELKHTPGPWRVEEGTTLIWGNCNQDDQTNYGLGYPIAECRLTPTASWAKGPSTYEEADANACLIAAAPEMLEALKSLVDDLSHFTDVSESIFHSLDLADAVIAKAEGRL